MDILSMSINLRTCTDVQVIFDICGDGPELDALGRRVEADNLGDTVIVHGRLERSDLLDIYANSHAVIVPTRSDFGGEGMPQVCAEAVLCQPSRHHQAVLPMPPDVLGAATILAKTDDIESYVRAIVSLIEDQQLYENVKITVLSSASMQFTDRSQSYPAAFDRLIASLFPARSTMSSLRSPFCGKSVLRTSGAKRSYERIRG